MSKTVKINKRSKIADYIKALGDNASVVEKGTIYDNTSYIDTGCYMLNAQVSASIYKGIPTHKILTLAGENSTGKTFLLLGILKNYLDADPDNLVVFFESEGAIDKDTIEDRGIDSSRILFKPVESVEQFKNISTQFVKNYVKDKPEERPNVLMCLDSLGMLPSEKEVKDAEEGNEKVDMTRPKIIKSLFRILTVKLASANIPLIVTNHVYATMDLYGKPEMGGGSGLKYAGSTILHFSKSQYKEKDENTKKEIHKGITVKSTTIKGRDTRINKVVKFIIHADYGLDKYSGLFNFCKNNGLVEKEGNRYYWASDGKDELKFQKHINSNPSKFFNEKRLNEIDMFCQSYFGYGNTTLENLSDEEIDDDDFDKNLKRLANEDDEKTED